MNKPAILAVTALVAAAALTGASAVADSEPALKVNRVNYNAVGADTAANRWQEAIYLVNTTDGELDISGWKVHDSYADSDGEHTNGYTFPAGTTVAKSRTVVISPASGVNRTDPNATQLFYMDFTRGYNGHFLNNGGDVVTVEDKAGTKVTSFSYDFDNGYYVR